MKTLTLRQRLKLAGTLTRLGEDVSKNKIFVDDILGELERLEAMIPDGTDLSPLKRDIDILRDKYTSHSAALINLGKKVDDATEKAQESVQSVKENLLDTINESEKIILRTVADLKKEVETIGKRIRAASEGGGAKNRKITIGGTDYFTRYTDLAFKAGSNVSFAVANNDQTKMVEFTITATGGSGSGITRSINSVAINTAAGSASTTDYVYLVTGTTTVTLPTAVGNSNLYTIKNVGTGVVTISTTGGQTIDGSASITLPVQYTAVDIESDTANWNVT